MASSLRRSLKEKARERLGFTLEKFRSKSTDSAPNELTEQEKENTEPPYTGLALVTGPLTGSVERIQAPTHTDDGTTKDTNRRRSRHLTQPKGTLEYAVSGNETLASIAAKFDTTTSELKKLNKLMTQMIWPGQKLFVPDKDFIPSEHSTPPVTPEPSPSEKSGPTFCELPMIRQQSSDPPHRGPGLAKPVEQPLTPELPKEAIKPSEQEARRLDDECCERFIKVGCKHITDGQGVVSGVLLVTPNAVMFDPNVSDPLVIEHGPNKYGLIAPMETVISVAMYHDIAAMRLQSAPQNSSSVKPAVYHAATCPMSKELKESSPTDTPDLIKDIPKSRKRTQSMCSCGADSLLGSPAGPDFIKLSSSHQHRLLEEEAIIKEDELSLNSEGNNSLSGSPLKPGTNTATTTTSLLIQGNAIDSTESTDLSSGKNVVQSVDKLDTGTTEDEGVITNSDKTNVPLLNIEDTSQKQQQQRCEKDIGNLSAAENPSPVKDITDGQAVNKPVKVVNAMTLSEKPELFRSLDELIPKPAAQFVDPPLYLCIRVGQLKKRSSKTCPIESYNKTRHKPEYWFSIPKEKVDPLYAFFIQWSPELYGDDDDIDIEARGFVAVDDVNYDEEEIEVIDDFFDAHPLSRARRVSLSKGWEVISSDAASLLNIDEVPLLPELLSESVILKEEHLMKLCEELPPRAEGYAWKRLYSTAKDGFSLKTLYRTTHKTDCPTLLVVHDTSSQVFGAMLSCGPRMSDHFYGTGESYLFTFYEEFRVFRWTGTNNFFVKGNMESLAVGAEEGSFGLWLDSDLYHGRTQKCSTFDNELLTDKEDFVISSIEAWTFV